MTATGAGLRSSDATVTGVAAESDGVEAERDAGRIATALGLASIVAFVAFLRLVPMLAHDWPLEDGGLFYVIIGDVLKAGFALPSTVSYEGGFIPFAYPPLGFYVAAALEGVTQMARSDILRLLPTVATIACVATMYPLAAELVPSRRHALAATAFYGALLGLTNVLAAGGGLTRSLGVLLALLATWQGVRMYRSGSWRNVAATALLAGLAVLAHPEAGPFIAISLAAAWLTRWRTLRALEQTVVSALGALLVIAPWAATVIARHGIDPFVTAAMGPSRDLYASFMAYVFFFVVAAPMVGLLDIAGQAGQLLRRKPHLLVWRMGAFGLDLRFSPISAAAPVSLLAAHGLLDSVVPLVWRIADRLRAGPLGEAGRMTLRRAVVLVVIALAFLPALDTARDAMRPQVALSRDQRDVMLWVRDHTPAATRVVVLATDRWASDDVSEWFPALSERRSATASQGLEWTTEPRARAIMSAGAALLACQSEDHAPVACVDHVVRDRVGVDNTVVYVDRATDNAGWFDALANGLLTDRGYRLLHSSEAGVVIAPEPLP